MRMVIPPLEETSDDYSSLGSGDSAEGMIHYRSELRILAGRLRDLITGKAWDYPEKVRKSSTCGFVVLTTKYWSINSRSTS